jgi:hypothetical protein
MLRDLTDRHSFEEALKKLLNTPPVNPVKRKRRGESEPRKK